MKSGSSFLFGPVASRRLGRSLGVDLVPSKYCSFDCVYCEAGLTTRATAERREYIPTAEILRELDDYLRSRPPIDIVTFSGAGEPTLHSGLGSVIAFLKRRYPEYRVALLTNSSLLSDAAVRRECRPVDLLMPSLDAVDADIAARINRPVSSITPDALIEGLKAFRSESDAEMWLEFFVVPGINDSDDHLLRWRQAVMAIAPDRVQINTLDRPGPESWVQPADRENLERIAAILHPLQVEIIARNFAASVHESAGVRPDTDLGDRIVELVRRRPSTAEDLAGGLGVPGGKIDSILRDLQTRGVLTAELCGRGLFYRETGKRGVEEGQSGRLPEQ